MITDEFEIKNGKENTANLTRRIRRVLKSLKEDALIDFELRNQFKGLDVEGKIKVYFIVNSESNFLGEDLINKEHVHLLCNDEKLYGYCNVSKIFQKQRVGIARLGITRS